MRTKYISLTDAIALYEGYRIEFIRKNDLTLDEGEEMIFWKLNGPEMTRIAPFLFHIQNGKINLYGHLCLKKTALKKVPNVITNKIQIPCLNPIFVFPIISYVIYNNYDYKESYNPSVNYDVLRSTSTLENVYTDLSVKYKELVKLIKSIFKEEETND
jgi:hypothetical protein